MDTQDHEPEELSDEDIERLESDYDAAESPEERYDLALALGDVWLGIDAETSLSWYERALAELPGDAEAMAGKAEALFESWRFDDAAREATAALKEDSKAARAHYVKAMLAERKGKDDEAMGHYRKAAAAQGDRFFVPFVLPRGAFEDVVSEALKTVPEEVQRLLAGVTVVVEDVPSDAQAEDLRQDDMAPTLLGLFEGTPPLRAGTDSLPELPPRLTLYQKNLERISADRETLLEEIAHTVLHEVGHAVGMDEDDLEDAGYE